MMSCASNVIKENTNSKEVIIEEYGKSLLMVYIVIEGNKNIFGISMNLKDKNWWNCGTESCGGLEVSNAQMDRVCKIENPNSYFLKKESNISLNKNLYFLCYAEKPLARKV